MQNDRRDHVLRVVTAVGWIALVQALLFAGFVLLQSTPQTPSLVVVSPRHTWAGYVANQINTVDGHPVRAYLGGTEADALADLRADRTQGVLLVDPTKPQDSLTVSSAQGVEAAATVRVVAEAAQRASSRTVVTADITAPSREDHAGRHGYHLALSWLFCGLAFTLAVRRGQESVQGQLRGVAITLVAGAPVVAVSVGIAALTIPAWAQDALRLFVIGTATFVVSALLARAALALAGPAGLVGWALALTFVAASPSRAGAEGFGRADVLWQPIGPWTPPGLAVSAVRQVVQLGQSLSASHWAGFVWWAALAVLLCVIGSANRPGAHRHGRSDML